MQLSRPLGSLEYFYHLLGVDAAACPVCGCRNLIYPPGIEHPSQDLNRRREQRLDVYCPATFTGESGTGEGMAVDLSMNGCKLCTPMALAVGDCLRLQIQFEAQATPVVIERSVIRWTYEVTVGLEFLQLQERERARLHQVLQVFTTSHTRIGSLELPDKPSENAPEEPVCAVPRPR